jgi:hypothetical protein
MKRIINKNIRRIIFLIWVCIGVILVLLPIFIGDKFEIESNKKFVYIYIICSLIFPQIFKLLSKYRVKE